MTFDARIEADERERTALDGLREAIASMKVPVPANGPPLDDELNLLRFVRGYHLVVKDAAKAFSEMLEYRAANGIDAAREAMHAARSAGEELAWPETLEKFAPLVACTGGGLMRRVGSSAEGDPATLCLIHLYDVKKAIREGLTAMLIEYQQYQDEWWHCALWRESKAAGRMLARVDVVAVHELSLFHFDISASRCLMKILEGSKHYPESCARLVTCGNGKALLAMFKAVIEPFMPKHTKEKLLVLGKEIESPSNKAAIGFDEPTFATLLELTGRTALPEVS